MELLGIIAGKRGGEINRLDKDKFLNVVARANSRKKIEVIHAAETFLPVEFTLGVKHGALLTRSHHVILKLMQSIRIAHRPLRKEIAGLHLVSIESIAFPIPAP